MAGFALPKLRWLIVGAVAAGVWVIKHDPIDGERHVISQPSRSSAQRKQGPLPNICQRRPPRRRQAADASATQNRDQFDQIGRTTRLSGFLHDIARAPPLEGCRKCTHCGNSRTRHRSDGPGAFRKVAPDYRRRTKGLGARRLPGSNGSPAPRPKQVVAKATKNNHRAGFPSWITRSRMSPVSRRPARPPQHGDCQCPYDLMIDGKQCGDRSAYVMRAGKPGCYL